MIGLLKQRLMWRFLALGVLTLCLSMLSRSNINTQLARTQAPTAPQLQTKSPTIKAQIQPEAPLAISSLRTISWDGQYLEVAMELVNISKKPIRAYAIKQALAGETQLGQVFFTSLEANNKSALQPNQFTTSFDIYQARSSQEDQVVFFVDYVEFSDGTKWGPDSGKSAERSEGQRAAAYILNKRLLRILNTGTPRDVMSALERGDANIEPPIGRSEEWKEGFRFGCNSIKEYLKRAQMRGQLDQELRELAERFKEAK